MTTGALTYFDRVYVINLPHRTDRRREIAEQLERVGLAFDRAPVQLFSAVRPEAAGPFPSIGARGCFLSHLGVLQDAVRAGHDRIAILEDDVDFVPDFDGEFARVVALLRATPWNVFYGGYRVDPAWRHDGADSVAHAVPADMSIATSHFVGFARQTIADVARYLGEMLARPEGDPSGGPMHVDGAYSWYRAAHPACRTWVADRQLAVQRPSRTDIHALHWYDRMPLVRDLAQVMRRRGASR